MSTVTGQVAAIRPTGTSQPTVAPKSSSEDFASLLPETGADGNPVGTTEVPIGTIGNNPAPTQAPPPGTVDGSTGTIDTADAGTGGSFTQVGSGLNEVPVGLMDSGNDAAPAPGTMDSPAPGTIETANGSGGSVGSAGNDSGTNEIPIGTYTTADNQAPAPGQFDGSGGNVYDQAGELLAQLENLLTGSIQFAPVNGVPAPGEWQGDSGAIAASNAYQKLQAVPIGMMNSTTV